MARPDPAPTEARLFPLEHNATADLDAKALDKIHAELRKLLERLAMTSDDKQARVPYAVFATNVRAHLHNSGRPTDPNR